MPCIHIGRTNWEYKDRHEKRVCPDCGLTEYKVVIGDRRGVLRVHWFRSDPKKWRTAKQRKD